MFTLQTKPFPVAVEHGEERFTLLMTPITAQELVRELRRPAPATEDEVGERLAEVLESIRVHTQGWEGVGDADGQPLEFSPERLELLIGDTERLWAIYWVWVRARQERAQGN